MAPDPFVPYVARPQQLNEGFAPVRLIAVELRVRSPWGDQEEVAMLPLDIELPWPGPGGRWTMPCTLHTSRGDVGFDILPPP